ncbi:protein containing von Willebrand factor, type A domain [Sulfurimonas gotlandica GD1]|uniref:Protein containing von Willebrand factor, type A domain n=1 Tax=Sulfurimonas gotlandica (strain DSM 19862 / JCM 16533 / GD1) TaxID=929558 RepID=B6BJ58_SULGG|nr:VWA domain-containing protein [Sulfurimonas gotlandica]EDZ63057.1 phage/colicin/tellurite resistance cluster TerY protein [Sulfurimonas gotlandica GD1]EHP30573.1 protein containing von Willebrand factor, type A domain [Sulfurimonas gotlandica GD1]
MAFNPADFVVEEPKSIPVVLLLDVSYSMQGENIDTLNKAVESMLNSFKKAETMETFIKLSIITFGSENGVDLHTPLTEVSKIDFKPLTVSGSTPMGAAFKMGKAMIEDKDIFKGRDYRPTIVLLSDGEPNDDWRQPLDDFVSTGRTKKCDRMALAIGAADKTVLNMFIEGCENSLFYAEDAENIIDEFKKITMSVTQRTKSVNKNQTINIKESLDNGDINLDDLDNFDI